jgi:hypothetical protein
MMIINMFIFKLYFKNYALINSDQPLKFKNMNQLND